MLKKARALYYHGEFSSETIKTLRNVLINANIENIPKNNDNLLRFSSFLPAGTIVAQSLESGEDKFLCLPMLSSNVSLPVKQGEYIWYFTDENKVSESFVKERPLTMINHYWLSRIHGTLVSEDLNYTYKERDASVLNKDVSDDSELANDINLPDFEAKNFLEFSAKKSQKESSTESLYVEGVDKYFNAKATPRYFSKTDDLTLQGSYNTLINFSKTNVAMSHITSSSKESIPPSGSINIVAGRLALKDFKEFGLENNSKTTVLTKNVANNSEEKNFLIDDKNYSKINNSLDKEELFKRPDFYLNYSPKSFLNKESAINFDKDASSLLINESLEADNEVYYNIDLLKDFHESCEKDFIEIESEEYPVQTRQKGRLSSVPTILAKSNNIRLIARKELVYDSVLLPEGSIRLIKESNNILNYSHINMESNGCVDIAGSTIKVGNFLTEYIRFLPEAGDYVKYKTQEELENLAEKLAPNDLDKRNFNKDVVSSMIGKGAGVVIGYDENLSESLVLGQTLKKILEDILATNVEFVNELKTISAALENHTHMLIEPMPVINAVPVPGGPPPFAQGVQTGMPSMPLEYSTFNSTGSKNLENKYNEINNNLINMLSKFAKTT